ncbi:MAG TPA: uracil permease [Firmicutes bacterium]|jgi:uracil permease|nr:uracil permease [Bacillota bacterium]HOQ24798.1 uracil permease [Bacillota bacterium]HPT68103.1 uracil permease [Bacillota bacterium]
MSPVIGINEKPALHRWIPLSFQHLFAMFGATVLVPYLTGLDPSTALFTSGLGTLIFILCTGGKVPAYLGSSFAYIAALQVISKEYGVAYAMGGAVVVGLIYCLVAFIIKQIGLKWLDKVLPPVVIGSVIIVIGMGLAPTAIEMASKGGTDTYHLTFLAIAGVTLLIAVLTSTFTRGFLSVVPVLVGIAGGYIFAALLGKVNLEGVHQASWFGTVKFLAPQFNLSAITAFSLVSLVTIAEHLGDILVLSKVACKDFYKDPGLHRTLMGDGIATSVAALFGGPPNTTYGENIGVMAITQVYSVWVTGGAAVLAIILSFFHKFGALIQSIPVPVMGGICIMLFGVIASSGLRTLVESGIDYSDKRNLIISSVILVLGIGGAKIQFGQFQLGGMALAALVGIILNLILPHKETIEPHKKSLEDLGKQVPDTDGQQA